MILRDRYDLPLSTQSQAARDGYVEGVDLFLSSNVGAEAALHTAIDADPNFALAHMALARVHHVNAKGKLARTHLADARALVCDTRETAQIDTLGTLIEGNGALALEKARAHLSEHPRDALVAQICLGVFGLIGFSGRAGREAENLALANFLAPAYGQDWWFLSALSFSQSEMGETIAAETSIAQALALNPRNANAAHHRAHLYYELGETDAGLAYLTDWQSSYDKRALLHCHLSWHRALWSMAKGDSDTMWAIVDADIAPPQEDAPAINVLTDLAALLYRAELAGVKVPKARWQAVSEFASQKFPRPAIAFADVHAALAHAMAGNAEGLIKVQEDAKGPAADMVKLLSEAFSALAAQNWTRASALLGQAAQDHARIGGSRAQRDLIEHALIATHLRIGQRKIAEGLLQRRPDIDPPVIQGL